VTDLRDVVRYENEHSALDFKAVQYRKDSHEDFLTDVLAMANANVLGDRHIIVGVKHHADGTRDLLGIKTADFVDPAIYQDLVRANIEPHLDLEYFSIELDGTLLGVIRISGCDHQPYLMKKDFGRLRTGDGFIRKGSHQTRLTRSDLDQIIAAGPKDAELVVSLSPSVDVLELAVPALNKVELASDRAADKIRAILREREEQRRNPGLAGFGPGVLAGITMPSILGGTPYHLRSDDELRKNLGNIKDTYKEDDLYELFEKHASRLNVYIRNTGTQYVEDVAVELRIPAEPGITVAERIHPAPDHSALGVMASLSTFSMLMSRYPQVVINGKHILIRNQLGAIKHHRTTPAFAEPLRIALSTEIVGRTLPLDFVILAKNLRAPTRRQLQLRVTEPPNTIRLRSA